MGTFRADTRRDQAAWRRLSQPARTLGLLTILGTVGFAAVNLLPVPDSVSYSVATLFGIFVALFCACIALNLRGAAQHLPLGHTGTPGARQMLVTRCFFGVLAVCGCALALLFASNI